MMASIAVAPKTANSTLDDPLMDLERLTDPRRIPPELPHYLLKMLLARLPRNRKVYLSVHLYPKALILMATNNVTVKVAVALCGRFVQVLVSLCTNAWLGAVLCHSAITLAIEDPLLTPHVTYNPVRSFHLLKLLLARLQLNDRAKVTNPLLVVAIYYMHETHLWDKLSPFDPICSPIVKRTSTKRNWPFKDEFDWRARSSPRSSPSTDLSTIDWSAPPHVDSTSAKLVPSLQLAPECTNVVYGNEHSKSQVPSSLKSQKEEKVVSDVDSFGLHKTFCLLCATSDHSLVNCPETPAAKRARIGDLKLCEKWVNPGHFASDCTELVVCVTCGHDNLDYIYHKPTYGWTVSL